MLTPCYIIDEGQLCKNVELFASVMKNTGCKILLAQKAFSNYDFYPIFSTYLSGTEASGLYNILLFGDMAIYSTCKNNTFNGMPLPNIWRKTRNGKLIRLTDFGYNDFKMRLGELR